jgi:lysophospholipase L1-like esterase
MSYQTSVLPQGTAISKSPAPHAEGANSGEKTRRFGNRRSLIGFLLVALFLTALVDWFSASTQRLYVDEDSDASRQEGTVWQHFGVRGHDVVAEIISRDEARFVFPISLATPHWLLFEAQPDGAAEYQIILRRGGRSQEIARRKITSAVSEKISLPAGQGELQFVVHGRIAWFDPRLVRKFFLWPVYLGAFIALALAIRNRPAPPSARARIGNGLALIASTVICLAVMELVLRRVALKLPPAVLSARHDLGLFAPDPRWIDSPRYQQRLRPNLNTICEWQFGDIVRMGFLPPELSEGVKHRYPFQTDAEGFRNPAVRARIDIAALGDSFTDAMTSPVKEGWPARLEQITGRKVQNYGTSAFGPQQELYVLQDFAIQHQPRDVVLAFFAGNDLFDAERFDRWEHGGDKPGEETTGWRIRKRFRRYETLFLTTLARTALPVDAPQKIGAPSLANKKPVAHFDRGIYEIPLPAGGHLRFAVMPAYLQKLGAPREELERSRGWELASATLRRMKETCERAGSRLTVMFVPPKAEVYWPLIEQSLGQEELQRAIDFSCSYNHMPLRAAEIHANRLAQNDLLRDFCAEAKIPFVDLTPVLEQNAAAGRAVYFSDDAHWNAAGHEVAARELAKFLARQP